MYIESIAIESFGSYKNYACTFDRGINIIEGPNEAGKTTLGAFIKFIFYGLSRKAPQGSLAEVRRYRSWDSETAAGSLVFEHGGKRYRIERSIKSATKAGGGESVKIIDLSTNTECYKGEHPGKLFFGVEEDAFSQTAYVGQTDGGKVNGKTVSAAIENMLFSGDETVSTTTAQKKLDEARVLLRYKVRRGGRIVELEDKIDDLTRRRETARVENKLLLAKETEKRELAERFEREKAALSTLEKQLERAREREKLSRFEYYDTLCADADEKENAYRALVDGATHGDFLPDDEYIQKIEGLRTKLSYLDAQIKQNENDRSALGNGRMTDEDRVIIDKVEKDGGIVKIRENVRALLKKRKNLLAAGCSLIGVGVIFSILALVCLFAVKAPNVTVIPPLGLSATMTGVCAAVVGFAVLCLGVFMTVLSSARAKARTEIFETHNVFTLEELEERFSASSHRQYLQNIYEERLNSIETRHGQLAMENEKYLGEMKDLLGAWGREYTSTDMPNEAISEVRDLIRNIADAASEKEKAASARDAFVKTLEEYDREAITRYLEESASYGDVEDGMESALRLDFDRRTAANRLLEDEVRRIELDVARLAATTEDPTALSDEIEHFKAEKDSLELCHEAYLLAIDAISNASDKLRDDIAPRLAMHASAMMRKETMGKYEQLGVDENFALAYGSDAGGVGNIVTRDIEFLSEGTKDLAYISLRIALVSLLFTKAKPPMLFDESFARLDDTRLENMLATLDDVAKSGCQIFIFTSQTRDAKIMEKVGALKHILL